MRCNLERRRLKASLLAIAGGAAIALQAMPVQAESLGSAVRRAVRTNPAGLAAAANAGARLGELKATRSLYLPTVESFGELGLVNNSVNGSSRSPDVTARIGIEASYTLYDGYRRANQVYFNAARLDESLYNALSAASTVSLNAVEAYVDVVRHRELLALARLNIRRHRRIRGQIVQQVAGGKSPISDRFQIDERLLAAEAVQEEIRKSLADAEVKYEKAVGRRPKGKMRIPRVKHLPKSLSSLKHSVRSRNVAIKRAQKSIAAADYALEGEKEALTPTFSLNARVSEGNDAGGFKGRNRDAFVGLRLAWTLYDGGASDARQEARHAEVAEASYRRDGLIRDVLEVAGRAWNAYRLGRKRHVILTRQEDAAAKIVANYREEYSLSKRSLLDVLDSERARFNTSFQRVSAFAGYRFAEYRMLAVQSRLVEYFGAKAPVPVTRPAFEERVASRPTEVFNITIDPLR